MDRILDSWKGISLKKHVTVLHEKKNGQIFRFMERYLPIKTRHQTSTTFMLKRQYVSVYS
jgi:hypothetical protein